MMGRRRVDDERLRGAMGRVIVRARRVRTLERLARLVNDELARDDPKFAVSAARVRRVAATHPRLRVQIHTRRGGTRGLGSACPVCTNPLERVQNRTLTGSRVVLEARCTVCPYWTGRARRVPVRYVFQPSRGRSGTG